MLQPEPEVQSHCGTHMPFVRPCKPTQSRLSEGQGVLSLQNWPAGMESTQTPWSQDLPEAAQSAPATHWPPVQVMGTVPSQYLVPLVQGPLLSQLARHTLLVVQVESRHQQVAFPVQPVPPPQPRGASVGMVSAVVTQPILPSPLRLTQIWSSGHGPQFWAQTVEVQFWSVHRQELFLMVHSTVSEQPVWELAGSWPFSEQARKPSPPLMSAQVWPAGQPEAVPPVQTPPEHTLP